MSDTNSKSSYDSNTSDDEISDIDLGNLKAYDFDPETSCESDDSESYTNSDDDMNNEYEMKVGNTNWCKCNHCKVMNTHEESLCCKDEVPQEYFELKECIIENEDFKVVCLNEAVLKTTLNMLNNLRGNKIEYGNISLRYAAYRQFTWWIHNRLGKGVRRVIPSCAIWAIRETYPDQNNIYIPFQEAREEERRL